MPDDVNDSQDNYSEHQGFFCCITSQHIDGYNLFSCFSASNGAPKSTQSSKTKLGQRPSPRDEQAFACLMILP